MSTISVPISVLISAVLVVTVMAACPPISTQLTMFSRRIGLPVSNGTSIEAPCSPPEADRESSKCKEEIPFYCSSLANPAAPATGFPLRSNKLRGMRSLEHFQCVRLIAISEILGSFVWHGIAQILVRDCHSATVETYILGVSC